MGKWKCASAHELDIVRAERDELAAEVEDLRLVADRAREALKELRSKLPRTADGVPIIPDGEEPYFYITPKRVKELSVSLDTFVPCGHGCCSDFVPPHELFSTREAAEQARGKSDA